MLKNNNKYNVIKLIHDFSCIGWFIEKHALKDVNESTDKEYKEMLEYLKKDVCDHVEKLEKLLCSSCGTGENKNCSSCK